MLFFFSSPHIFLFFFPRLQGPWQIPVALLSDTSRNYKRREKKPNAKPTCMRAFFSFFFSSGEVAFTACSLLSFPHFHFSWTYMQAVLYASFLFSFFLACLFFFFSPVPFLLCFIFFFRTFASDIDVPRAWILLHCNSYYCRPRDSSFYKLACWCSFDRLCSKHCVVLSLICPFFLFSKR